MRPNSTSLRQLNDRRFTLRMNLKCGTQNVSYAAVIVDKFHVVRYIYAATENARKQIFKNLKEQVDAMPDSEEKDEKSYRSNRRARQKRKWQYYCAPCRRMRLGVHKHSENTQYNGHQSVDLHHRKEYDTTRCDHSTSRSCEEQQSFQHSNCPSPALRLPQYSPCDP